MKKIEIMVVFMIAGIVVVLGVIGSNKDEVRSKAMTCMANLKMIDCAKEQWAMDYHKGVNDVPMLEQLTTDDPKNECGVYISPIFAESFAYCDKGEEINESSPVVRKYYALMPKCPCRGKYRIGAIGEDPTCSYENKEYPHKLP